MNQPYEKIDEKHINRQQFSQNLTAHALYASDLNNTKSKWMHPAR
jgi:hypothetical protein